MVHLKLIKHLASSWVVRLRLVLFAIAFFAGQANVDAQKNVVMIVVDDLRTDPGDLFLTPNMDALAATGLSFNRAYSPVPICGAARASFLSGVLPELGDMSMFTASPPDVITLPDTFVAAGYRTRSLGKVYHNTGQFTSGNTIGEDDPTATVDDLDGWNDGVWRSSINWLHWQTRSPTDPSSGRGPAFESGTENGVSVGDEFYADGDTANQAIFEIGTYSQSNIPFFMAVGFDRPHLPFTAPAVYWSMYDPNQIMLPTDRSAPDGSPRSLRGSGEVDSYGGVPDVSGRHRTDGDFTDSLRRNLIHGYLASVSYMDAQVGRVIAALEDPNGDGDPSDSIRDETIIVLVSDHGYHIGEHGFWGKHTLLESALRIPMIICDPDSADTAGESSDALVSLMDIYPTLATLSGLETPDHVEGNDLTPLLDNPDLPWTDYIYSHFNSGDSIRTDRYRYIRWENGDEALFDTLLDPGSTQNVLNTAPASDLAEARSVLATHFQTGFQTFQPFSKGDVNRDGSVGFRDIPPFINILSGAIPFRAEADMDSNGFVNFFDISPFISILATGGA